MSNTRRRQRKSNYSISGLATSKLRRTRPAGQRVTIDYGVMKRNEAELLLMDRVTNCEHVCRRRRRALSYNVTPIVVAYARNEFQ